MEAVKKVMLLVHPRFRPDRASATLGTEHDVWRALRRLGYVIEVTGAEDDLHSFASTLNAFKPDIVFNLLEEFRGEAVFDFHLVSYLEALGIPYTGCNPRGLVLSRSKALVGQIAAGLGVPVPASILLPGTGRSLPSISLRYPLFVKLNREHASLGIRESNKVKDLRALKAECLHLRKKFAAEILVQEFVPGKDVSLALWGNGKPEVFAARQLSFGGEDRVSTEKLKFSEYWQKRRTVRSLPFRTPLAKQLEKDACRVYAALDLSGYARFDYRVSEDQKAHLIDVNANPNLSRSEDFALSARAKGMEYAQVIRHVLDLGMRYQPKV